jgi:lysophospholipase L1-like esterase
MNYPRTKQGSNYRAAGAMLIASAMMLIIVSWCRADGIVVQSGQKVAFLGDSITQLGWDSPTGYVHLVASGLDTAGVKITPIPAGISGNTSNDMLRRFDQDVIAKKPDWVTISCGVNDVWHNPGGVPLDLYEKNITTIVDKADAAGVKVIMLTATMIYEDQANANNQKLIPYNEFLRKLAADRKYPLADLNADMQAGVNERIKAGWPAGHLLTVDGVHPNPRGNVMMASGILKAMGLTDDQLTKANDVWLDIPKGCSTNLQFNITIPQDMTLRQWLALQDKVHKGTGGSVSDVLQPIFNTAVQSTLFPDDKNGIEQAKKQIKDKVDQAVEKETKQ